MSTVGCGGASDVKLDLVPASGKLTDKGKPLAGYEVHLSPASTTGRPAHGLTDGEGNFSLGTSGEANGAEVGKYTAYFVLTGADAEVEPGKEEIGMVSAPKSSLPAKLASPQTSDVTIEVPAGGSSSLNIEL